MEKISRPKKLSKEDRKLLSNERYQEYAEKQFKIIYDKIDEIIEKIN